MSEVPAELVERVRDSRHLVILTGAGVSAESGIATFRDPLTGLWENYRPEELASPGGFTADPQLVWDWYAWRRQQALEGEPNAAHHAIEQLERLLPDVTLVTQNVDGLHQRAGSQTPLELHGNVHKLKCFSCEADGGDWPADPTEMVHCQCGGLLRPGEVWFGESLPEAVINGAFVAAQDCDVFLNVGTSSLVYPAAGLPLVAKQSGAYVVEINPQQTPLSDQLDLCLRVSAGKALPDLCAALAA
ncbi:MAG TPA: NAD-dependent deacylase [Nocardioidaceae bacterium]|nr:NAD-dependent deacylase [Nocardioidaceae bacterium]